MKIVLSGVETNNKGAELMLYAILQEIEIIFPDAIVYIAPNRIYQGIDYIKTKLDLRYLPIGKLEQKLHLSYIFGRLHIPFIFLPHMKAIGIIDYYIDGSGFKFSDQFKLSPKTAVFLQAQLSAFKKKGTKIIFLPQAFGPFERNASKKILSVLSKNATIIMPREKVSMKYLADSGVIDMKKVMMFTDFTSLVEGIFPLQYEHLRGGICIIPNKQMINKGAISMDNYLSLLKDIVTESRKSGHMVYLLNHEGKKDEQLCKDLQKELPDGIEYVSGLNALEVKGLISTAYLTISSRFHGVASSLNSCIPCLATSWSHKYKELFDDYAMKDCVLPLNEMETAKKKIAEFLQLELNKKIRDILSKQLPSIKEESRKMWDYIWSC